MNEVRRVLMVITVYEGDGGVRVDSDFAEGIAETMKAAVAEWAALRFLLAEH